MWYRGLILIMTMAGTGTSVSADQDIIFYPSYAYRAGNSAAWNILVHGAVVEPKPGFLEQAVAVTVFRRAYQGTIDPAETEILSRRMGNFLIEYDGEATLAIRLGDHRYELGKSDPEGRFHRQLWVDEVRIRDLIDTPDGWMDFESLNPAGQGQPVRGRVQFVNASGVSIISDIDDTVKDSQVTDRRELLANTFLRQFRPVPGMPAVYRYCARRGVVFHYVSGSPWQLYRPLAEFFAQTGVPEGSFHLRPFELSETSFFSTTHSHESMKLSAIEPILAAFPRRRFILIGDSGEQDPEIYGKLARRYPDQISAIFIRNVTEEFRGNRRCQAAFQGIDSNRWMLFERAGALLRSLEPLLPEPEVANRGLDH